MNKTERDPCIACGSASRYRLWSAPTIHGANTKTYDLMVCRRCGLGTIYPFPSSDDIRKAYTNEYSNYLATYSEETFARWKSRVFRMGKRVFAYAAVSSPDGHWKPAFPKHAGILDAGCATGMYLYFLKMQGYHNIHGLEMSAKAADFGRRMGLDIRTGTISECELEPHSFDIIRLHHVLEHVPDPRGDLHKLVKALRPGGLLLLRVPVLRSVEATLLKSRWASWDPPRHIYYFTPESIGTLLKNSNLSVVKTRRDSRGHDLLKGLLVTFFGKFFDGRKSLVDSPNNPIAIVALKPAGFVLDLLRASDEMLFVARKQ